MKSGAFVGSALSRGYALKYVAQKDKETRWNSSLYLWLRGQDSPACRGKRVPARLHAQRTGGRAPARLMPRGMSRKPLIST
ncbi:MAG: hypothetical protein A3B30_04560 [Candidatus Komeilibacteria bacterium RIFCSPLOWO2_01_FULL_52_15]|uniref:Uncharacterized protein n=1 Tax=Candidatus Komeilibacteria bacterium RIFCSPLOWO2_01_FULL_52_15 TaxID=1798551 RepID=A0A1G2BUX5_9BACT|nr:MAG: hypothetical protein A3B30_04560 [Candidatus Komeilibacteria bacterium RIFCSPLOWO2_01_FULL_52_15]